MDCTKYRKLIHEFIDNEISNENELALLSHITSCEDCKLYLSNMSKIKTSIKESFTNHTNLKNIDVSKNIMTKIKTEKETIRSKKSMNIFYKVALIILALSAIFISKQLKQNKNDFTFKEEERMVFEHLEKSFNSTVVNVAYSQRR